MNCPKCNSQNPPDSKFCYSCGNSLPQPTGGFGCGSPLQTAPSQSTGGFGGQKLCANGHVIDPSWDICPYCPQSSSQPPSPSQTGGGKKTVMENTGPIMGGHAPTIDESSAMGQASYSYPPPLTGKTGGRPVPPTEDESVKRQPPVPFPPTIQENVGRKTMLFQEKKPPIVGWLVAMNGRDQGEDYKIRAGKNTIGSSPDNDICIGDSYASGKHASLKFADNEYFITDLDSSNGTVVNEKEISKMELKDNDVIRIGETKFKFKALFIPSQKEDAKTHEQ